MIRRFFYKFNRSFKNMKNVIFHVKLLSPTLSLSLNKRCFFQVNFLINAEFENAAFIREWCLFHISLPKYGVYWRAVFKRGNSVKYFTSVCSAGIILWWGGLRGGSHEIFTNREEGPTIFLLLPGGIKNLTEYFIPFLPHPPPPPPVS